MLTITENNCTNQLESLLSRTYPQLIGKVHTLESVTTVVQKVPFSQPPSTTRNNLFIVPIKTNNNYTTFLATDDGFFHMPISSDQLEALMVEDHHSFTHVSNYKKLVRTLFKDKLHFPVPFATAFNCLIPIAYGRNKEMTMWINPIIIQDCYCKGGHTYLVLSCGLTLQIPDKRKHDLYHRIAEALLLQGVFRKQIAYYKSEEDQPLINYLEIPCTPLVYRSIGRYRVKDIPSDRKNSNRVNNTLLIKKCSMYDCEVEKVLRAW